MAERDVVGSMRANAKPQHRVSIIDLLLGAVALASVGALGYVGLGWWSSQSPPASTLSGPPSPMVVAASLGSTDPWTESDTDRCQSRGYAASQAPIPPEIGLANPAVTEGFANLATVLTCRITTKTARFCDPAEKATLVALVNDYVARMDLIVIGLNVEGAPMNIMGEMMGGEVALGSSVHDYMRDSTIDYMRHYSRDVAAGLKTLVSDGIVRLEDFGFMGMGVHRVIKEMLDGATATRNICG